MPTPDDASARRVTQRGYLLAYLVVAVLVVATYLLAHAPLGAAALPVALAIATLQAVVVALWLMHLVEQRGARRFALPVAVSLIVLLLALVFADVGGRYAPVRPGGSAPRRPRTRARAGAGRRTRPPASRTAARPAARRGA